MIGQVSSALKLSKPSQAWTDMARVLQVRLQVVVAKMEGEERISSSYSHLRFPHTQAALALARHPLYGWGKQLTDCEPKFAQSVYISLVVDAYIDQEIFEVLGCAHDPTHRRCFTFECVYHSRPIVIVACSAHIRSLQS